MNKLATNITIPISKLPVRNRTVRAVKIDPSIRQEIVLTADRKLDSFKLILLVY